MGNLCCTNDNERNNLESYLNDVYEKECVFEAYEEEVEFIQTGIETLVQTIVDLVIDSALSQLERLYKHIRKTKIKLKKVYFSSNYPKVKTARSKIIKVGSFYEGTKNKFPNEFDFIFPIFHLVGLEEIPFPPMLLNFHYLIQEVIESNKQSLFFIDNQQMNVTIELHRFLQEHGPASMLRFIYINSRGYKRYIHVDLVPAHKVSPDSMEWCLKKHADISYRQPFDKLSKSFNKEILSKETCFLVSNKYSFTETEVHFMRKVLSDNHRKVYRILKFLINGHGDGEILNLLSPVSKISSYEIKMMMIEHHDECENPDTINIGDCVKQVLDQITLNYPFKLTPTRTKLNLNKLIQSLRTLQATEDTYNYDQVKIKSVARQYMDGIDRNDSHYVLWFRYLDTLDKDGPCMDSFEQLLDAEKPGWRWRGIH